MKVLVAVASKHGATLEIAEAIAREIKSAGLECEVAQTADILTLDEIDAVALGSAVYMGRWMEDARRFVEQYRDDLIMRPVWLFSSGPIGDPPKPEQEAIDIEKVREAIRARQHRTFPGELSRDKLGLAEKLAANVIHAPSGDYRNWGEIAKWARSIAETLQREEAQREARPSH